MKTKPGIIDLNAFFSPSTPYWKRWLWPRLAISGFIALWALSWWLVWEIFKLAVHYAQR